MPEDIAYLLVRVAAGSSMLVAHGLPKLMDFSQKALYFPDPFGFGGKVSLGLAVFAEVFCAIALILGLFTKLVSWPLVATMAVAAFHVHANDPWSKKELAFVYLLLFVVFAIHGGGRFALDSKLRRGW
jgi:putative oxidoreductase